MEKEPKLVNTINKDELGIPKGVLIGLIGDNKQKTLYAVYEKTPAHGSKEHNVILSPFKTKEDAEQRETIILLKILTKTSILIVLSQKGNSFICVTFFCL